MLSKPIDISKIIVLINDPAPGEHKVAEPLLIDFVARQAVVTFDLLHTYTKSFDDVTFELEVSNNGEGNQEAQEGTQEVTKEQVVCEHHQLYRATGRFVVEFYCKDCDRMVWCGGVNEEIPLDIRARWI